MKEQRAREDAQRAFIEQQAEKKKKQAEMRANLKTMYFRIRPTNIQGQRTLKILEGLSARLELLGNLSRENLDGFPRENLSAPLRAAIEAVEQLELLYGAEKEGLEDARNKLTALLDDEENLEKNADQREALEAEIEDHENSIAGLEGAVKEEICEAVRLISPSDLAAFRERGRRSAEIFTDVDEIFQSVTLLYLKKLSTGFDEEESHKKMLATLGASIEQNTLLKEQKLAELRETRALRARENEARNLEINQLKLALESVVSQEAEALKSAEENSAATREKDKHTHADFMKQWKAAADEAKKKFEASRAENGALETSLGKVNSDLQSQIAALIEHYDSVAVSEGKVLSDLKVGLPDSAPKRRRRDRDRRE